MSAFAGYSVESDHIAGLSSADRKRRLIDLLQRILDVFRSHARAGTITQRLTEDDEFRQMAFTFSAIALCAKLARVDGAVTKEEFLAFREVFPMQDHLSAKIRELFVAACDDTTDYLDHAKRIAGLFLKGSPVIMQLFDRLCVIANADHAMSEPELNYLRKVAVALGLTHKQFTDAMRRHLTPHTMNPYAVLGIASNISNEALKRRYHELMRLHHPDRMNASASVEMISIANRKVAQINEAYHKILRVRGLK